MRRRREGNGRRDSEREGREEVEVERGEERRERELEGAESP